MTNYLSSLKKSITKIGGKGKFQIDMYLERCVSPTLADMLKKYAVRLGKSDIVHDDMEPSGCHENSMKFFMNNPGSVIWTGFALSDGTWRVHSWVVHNDKIIECTPSARKIHVGIPLVVENLDETKRRITAFFGKEVPL